MYENLDGQVLTSSQESMAPAETAGRLLKSRSKAEGLKDAIERLNSPIGGLQDLLRRLTGANDEVKVQSESAPIPPITLNEILNHGPDEIDKKATQLQGLINELREILI